MKKVLDFSGLCFVGHAGGDSSLLMARSSNAPTTTHEPLESKAFFVFGERFSHGKA
jgi:hypothetical protein